jgi:hypothetical protein
MNYTDIILAKKILCKEKQVDAHFVDSVTSEQEFKEHIRFFDAELDWVKPDWNEPQPITWEEILDVIDDVILEDKLNKCKKEARKLLAESDWAATTDVQSCIENPLDWLNYRDTVRKLFLRPQVNPTFPVKPEVRWII